MILNRTLLNVFRFGDRLQRYNEFRPIQNLLHALRKENKIPDTLLTLQYHPVYTLGKRGKPDHFLKPIEDLRRNGFDVVSIDRGGEVTYHGPGQIVVYPIIDLRNKRLGARVFVEKLENTIINLLRQYGRTAEGQIKDKTGVWIAGKKIAAIGVRISNGISSHGIAFNVLTNLQHYSHIIPCGLDNKDITSLKEELQEKAEGTETVEHQIVQCFVKEFEYELVNYPTFTEWLKIKRQKPDIH